MKTHYLFSVLMLSCLSQAHGQIIINEVSASNLDQYVDNHNDYGDWIELYNPSSSALNLSGYYLSDNVQNVTKWPIPNGASIPANGYLTFWASGRNEVSAGNYHTNFKLKQTKNNPDYVVLSSPASVILDSIQLRKTQVGHSYGRTTNGAATWSVFATPTFNASNNTSIAYTRYADKPDFDIVAGFYTSAVTVTISDTDPTATIYYTTDGSLPTISSTVYTAPITIPTTRILKAYAVHTDPTILPSFIEFSTYFINENHTIPVVSISGTNLEVLANGDNTQYPVGTFEYFNTAKVRVAKTYGEFNSHGQDSWVLSQRSLDFISRDEMGYNHSVEEQLFAGSSRSNFQRVILRAAGDDNYPADHNAANEGSAHVRDAFVHNLAIDGGLSLDVRRGAKIVVYIDGQYWGVYDIRENPDDHDFTDYYYGQDKFNLQYILTWGSTWAEYGGAQALSDWNTFYSDVMSRDLTIPSNWQYVENNLDTKSLVDYVCVNMFTVCSDWLNWNTGWWRGLDPSGTHKKWGYILWDNDATFGHYINYTGIPDVSSNAYPCDPESLSGQSDPEGHINLLNKLRQNPEFNQYYIAREIDLFNTVFSCDNMLAKLDSTVAVIDPEMTRHAARWSGMYNEWRTNVNQLRNFITQRCANLNNGLINCYSLNGPYPLTVDVTPANASAVKVNSLTVNSFPWTANYFGGMETKLEVLPNAGEHFYYWSANTHSFAPNINATLTRITLSAPDTVVAHFEPPLATIPLTDNAVTFSAFPTTFNQDLTVQYQLSTNVSSITLKLYSLLGNEMMSINNLSTQSGQYTGQIDLGGLNLSEGVYVLELITDNYKQSLKLVYAK